MMKNILLLNPPWINDRIIRDGYCSHTSKGVYVYPPLDLLMLSGILAKKHKVFFLDSVIERLDYKKSEERIIKINPDIIISLTGVLSFKKDLPFLGKLKDKLNCKLILLGDIAFFESKKLMEEYGFVDGILLDFTSDFILKFIDSDFKNLKGIVYRKEGRIITTKLSELKKFHLPTPLHTLLPLRKYSLSYGLYRYFSLVITAFGCPFNCSFCALGKLPYKEREIDEIVAELKYLEKLGIREIMFRDYSFNGNAKRCKELCKKMIKNKIKLKWSCEAVAINSDFEMLKLMKEAGCYLVMVGVESANDKILKDSRKPLTSSAAIKFFKHCKILKIQTLGHFILGLPGDTEESVNKTIEFSKKLGCDYASFNLYVPRIGSDLRATLTKNNKIRNSDLDKYDCSNEVAEVCNLSKEQLMRLKNKAVISFYFRPSQILKQIYFIRSKTRFINSLKNGYQVFYDSILKR